MEYIKCQVYNCRYNTQGFCHARSIEVKPQGGEMVQSSSGTYCETFQEEKFDDDTVMGS